MICSSVLLDITSCLCVCCVRMSSLKSLVHNVLPFCSCSVCPLLPCSLFYQSIFSGLILLLSNSRLLSYFFVIGQSVQVQVARLAAFVPQRSLLLPERCLRSLLALRNLFPPAHSLFRYSVLKLLLALGNISLRFTHRSIISPKLEKFF